MKKEDLLNLINDDDLGLLSVKPNNSTAVSADERLIASFLEINNFVRENKKEPEINNDLREHQLAFRLESIRKDKNKSKILLNFDEYNLLNVENKEIKNIKDIFIDDDLGILSSIDENLFRINNVPGYKERSSAYYIARRKLCENFKEYEPLFQKCQADLATGKRILQKFTSEKQVVENKFFVLNGVLLFIESIGKTYINKFGRVDGRQRCIFENGTESEMLFRSLVERLYENGRAVSENSDNLDLLNNFNVITNNDNKTGFLYILKSLSDNPKIKSLENLYKIGFSTIPVEDRIKNASEEATFLMAPVAIITTFDCYNFNPQKMEQLLHNFFGASCLNLDIFDSNNRRHTPREWFIAPLNIIEKTIKLIISGGIVNYKYDTKKQEIVLR